MYKFIEVALLVTFFQFWIIFGLEVSYERAEVLYFNRRYGSYAISTSRAGRGKPTCVNVHFQTIVGLGDNVTMSIYILERMSSGQYHPTPIQFHFKVCELLERDPLVGRALKTQLNLTCPFKPAAYHFKNVCLDLSSFHYFLPFAWTHQVYTEARFDSDAYITDLREPLYNVSIYIKVIQKPTMRKPSE